MAVTASDGCLDFFFVSENDRRRKRREKVKNRLPSCMAVCMKVIERKKSLVQDTHSTLRKEKSAPAKLERINIMGYMKGYYS